MDMTVFASHGKGIHSQQSKIVIEIHCNVLHSWLTYVFLFDLLAKSLFLENWKFIIYIVD